MNAPPLDTLLSRRALKGAAGLIHAAAATGALPLSLLARLLTPLGLAHRDSDAEALVAGLGIANLDGLLSLGELPWPGVARRVDDALLVHGEAALVDAALRLAAAHTLGRAPATITFTGASSMMSGEAVLDALDQHDGGSGPVLIVVGPAAITAELLSPAARDLQPVLRVLSDRLGTPAPQPSDETTYQLLPALESQSAELRDERARNDERAGIFATAGGTVIDLPLVDPDAVDERIAAAMKGADGLLLCVEPELLRFVLPHLQSRLKAVLVLAASDVMPGIAAELPGSLVDAASGHAADGLVQDAAINAREVGVEGALPVGEVAISAPSMLLAGAARRACAEAKAPVTDETSGEAVFLLRQAKARGELAATCRMSLAVHDAGKLAAARAIAVTFLNTHLAPARPASSGKKMRIRG